MTIDADWDVEIGGGAPVMEALWSGPDGAVGFVDLRGHSEEIGKIAEAAAFAPLADLLLALNSAESPVWTAKCDVWEPEAGAKALYIDMLPWMGTVFAEWRQAEGFCRELVARLEAADERGADGSVELVIRQAIAGEKEGFGVTAYLSAKSAAELVATMADFADAVAGWGAPTKADSKLQ
jgi:hypothetical protein